MRHVRVSIPDEKYMQFLQVIHQLGISQVQSEEDVPTLEDQKLVIDRINDSKREEMLNWEEFEAALDLDA